MFVALLFAGAMAGQNPLTVVSDRPPPLYTGARTFAACGRIEVEIEYYNTWTKGLQKLEGKAAFSRKSIPLSSELNRIQRESVYVSRVSFWCEAENDMRIAIETSAREGGHKRWVMSVDERLEAKLSGPEPVEEEIRP